MNEAADSKHLPEAEEWISQPGNMEAVIDELSDYIDTASENIVLEDHQVYAAVGRVMLDKKDYGRMRQEAVALTLLPMISKRLSGNGYEVRIESDPAPTSTGYVHRRIKARKNRPSI